jgi:hypothetical protein
VVLFRYSPTRAGEIAAEMLSGYEGYVQSDVFSGYNIPEAKGSHDRLFVCMAHVRRKFIKVIDARGRAGQAKTGSAEAALSYIGRLCEVGSHVAWTHINTCAFYLKDFHTPQTTLAIRQCFRRQSNLLRWHNFFLPPVVC